MEKSKARNSSIESIKILAIMLIVISHVVQSLEVSENAYATFDFVSFNLSDTTNSVRILLLSMLRYSGELGNTIFFICSAWFFLEDDRCNKRKVLSMLIDVWVVSVLVLIGVLIYRGGKLNGTLILTSLFPTTFENNWYVTCYILFYIIHPILNKIVRSLRQKSLLRLNVLFYLLYFGIAFWGRTTSYLFGSGTEFFSSRLIIWTVIYFIMAYAKLYISKEQLNNKALIVSLILIGIIGNYGLITLTNIIGLKNDTFSGALLIWINAYNPFIVVLGFGLFGLARSTCFESKTINFVSKLSLYIYIIHENRLLRLLYRPLLWQYVYKQFGYKHILGFVFALSFIVFIVSMLLSIIYYETIHRLSVRVSNTIYRRLATAWNHIENRLLGLR